MRFIAKYAKYAVQVRPQIVEAYATGHTKVIESQLTARFSIDLTTIEEKAIARQLWSFNGFYQEEDLVTVREPDYRISVFDSRIAQVEEGWSDAEREQVEALLITIAQRTPGDLIVMEEQRALPPWPTYDNFSGPVDELLTKIEEDGFDLSEVLAYERENQNRELVIEAMELELETGTDPHTEEELVG